MKTRIAALALALAFVAAPALGALAGDGCMPCGEATQEQAPCTSLSAASCCGDVAPAAPVKTAPELPSVPGIAGVAAIAPAPFAARAPRAAHDLAATVSLLRLSVVRRL